MEVGNLNKNIIVVATKLIKQKGDSGNDWKDYADFKNIENFVKEKIDFDVQVLPLKFSKAFDLIFEKEQSIYQLMQNSPLANYTYKQVNQQFEDIYSLIDKYDAK